MTSQEQCTQCGAAVVPADRFCENCGITLSAVRRVAIPRAMEAAAGPCADCGNGGHVDEYCTFCGYRRAEPDRDQMQLGEIVLITDRGLEHVRNEDAAAAGIVGGRMGERPYAIAVAVCDGVSTSSAAHTAAVAASVAGVDAMLGALAMSSVGRSAVLAGLAHAAKAAAAVGSGSGDASTAPACTYAAATVAPTVAGTVEITVGNVGDSRAYWLPETGATAECLTADDSVAQELITAGASADSDAVQSGAHTLTRWLGADAGPTPWAESSVHTITTADRGSLVLCTDGLWNYLPEADDIAKLCAGTDATTAACALVDYALNAGGQDNITVAVIPIGDLS
jgi:serine/threonine protein phosphatase PrpC